MSYLSYFRELLRTICKFLKINLITDIIITIQQLMLHIQPKFSVFNEHLSTQNLLFIYKK